MGPGSDAAWQDRGRLPAEGAELLSEEEALPPAGAAGAAAPEVGRLASVRRAPLLCSLFGVLACGYAVSRSAGWDDRPPEHAGGSRGGRPRLLPIVSRSAAADPPPEGSAAADAPPEGPFCGTGAMVGSGKNSSHARVRIWHYSTEKGEVLYPVSEPGMVHELPRAGKKGVGRTVFGWFEPDFNESMNWPDPEKAAKDWTVDMLAARRLGYTEFVAPTIGNDVCWLDFFLKGCERVPECPALVTHFSFMRFRTDCSEYEGDCSNIPFRDDLSYLVSFNRLKEKYMRRGFAIRGMTLNVRGCKQATGSAIRGVPLNVPAADNETTRYMDKLLRKTIRQVREGDETVIDNITNSREAKFIGFSGPDAHDEGAAYTPGYCSWQGPGEGGAATGGAAVRAIRSLTRLTWVDVMQENESVREGFFDVCQSIKDAPEEGWGPAFNAAMA